MTSCVLRASSRLGGGTDHIRSSELASGMKRYVNGFSEAEAEKSRREDGTEQPVR